MWTPPDEIDLLSRWGAEPQSTTARRLGRSVDACGAKMRRLIGSKSISRGRLTLSALARSSGYHRDTISAAVREMGMRRVVKSDGGTWVMSEDQAARIMTYLLERDAGRFVTRSGRRSATWSRSAAACVSCGDDESPHWARGRCHPCYERDRRSA